MRKTNIVLFIGALGLTGLLSGRVLAASYDLRAAGIESIDEVSSFSVSDGGIAATLTALVGGASSAADVLNRTASGFGVNAAAVGDVTDNVDGINGNESVKITFDQRVHFDKITLSLFSTPTQFPPTGDKATLHLPDGDVVLVPTSSSSDVYTFAVGNNVDIGESVTISWVAGNGFSFDAFEVSAAVPLPAATWGGLALLGCLAIHRLRRYGLNRIQ